jgi:hypothetical protein
MQALLPQPPEACKAYLDSNVQEVAQEGYPDIHAQARTQEVVLHEIYHILGAALAGAPAVL